MSSMDEAIKHTVGTLLRCPRCKERLALNLDTLECPYCKGTFNLVKGSIPVFDLYVDDQQNETGRDPEQAWDLDGFERGYQKIGYHESGVEFDKKLGYPVEVSTFMFERVKKRMLDWLRPTEGHRILDVGCGSGHFLSLMSERYRQHGFTPSLVGVDISTYQLSYMVHRMSRDGVNDAVAVHGNGEYLPFANESFDVVTCSEVLEHIRNPSRALSEMYRILKQSGILLLSTPSMSAQKGWSRILSPVATVVKLIRGYKPDPDAGSGGYDIPWYANEFKKAIIGAGFSIKEFEYNALIPHPWYFKFIPEPMVRPAVSTFVQVDRYLKFILKGLALHFVVRADKGNDVPKGGEAL